MIKVVLLDADGVITPSKRFSIQLQEDYGITLDQSKPFFNDQFQKCLAGKSSLRMELPGYLSTWKWPYSTEDFIHYWLESSKQTNISVLKTVMRLRKNGIKCYIATNQENERTGYMQNEMGFDKLFDGIYSSAKLGVLKPSYEFFYKILDDIACDADHVLYWDDSEKNILVANSIGINGELYKSHKKMITRMREYGLNI